MTSKPHSELVAQVEAGIGLYEDTTGDTQRFCDESRAALRALVEQLDAGREALEAADRLLDDVYAKGAKHADDLLRVRTQVRAALGRAPELYRPNPGEETHAGGACGKHGVYIGRVCPECSPATEPEGD